MRTLILRRFAALVPTLLGTVLLIFIAVFLLPGNAVTALAGKNGLAPQVQNALIVKYHLNDPLIVQLGHYLGSLLTGNLGFSLQGESINTMLVRAWPVTAQLALTAWVLQLVTGVSLGVIAASRPGGLLDRLVLSAMITAIAIPAFVLAFLAQTVVSMKLGWLPVAGIADGWPRAYLLPAIVLATNGFGAVARIARASTLDALSSGYILTARTKGLSPSRILFMHALPNGLIPIVSFLGVELANLLAGSVVVEGIFNLPGVGGALFQAIGLQDGTVILGFVSVVVVGIVVLNLVTDLLYSVLDPRLRHA